MSNKLKERIEDLEKKQRLVEDNQLECVYVVDAETLKFEYITPSIEKLSGYSADEYINFTVGERLTPDSFMNVLKILGEEKKRFQQGVKISRTLELEIIHRDGRAYWIETTTRFKEEPGKPLKLVGVLRDIDERKKAEKKKNELIRELGEALAEKERLLKENKILRDLLPICSGCKRIRDEDGKWWPLDAYIAKQTDSEITHTICPDCSDIYINL